jgi:hypothetical protein
MIIYKKKEASQKSIEIIYLPIDRERIWKIKRRKLKKDKIWLAIVKIMKWDESLTGK